MKAPKRKVCLELRFHTDDDFGLRIEPKDMADREKLDRLPFFPFFKTRHRFAPKGSKTFDGYYRDDEDVVFLRNVHITCGDDVYCENAKIPAEEVETCSYFNYYLRLVDTPDKEGLNRMLYAAYDIAVNRFDAGTHAYHSGDWFEMWRPIIDALTKNISRIKGEDDRTELSGPVFGAVGCMSGNYSGTRLWLAEVSRSDLPRIVKKTPEGKQEARCGR